MEYIVKKIPSNIKEIVDSIIPLLRTSHVKLILRRCLPGYIEYTHRLSHAYIRAKAEAAERGYEEPYRTAYINFRVLNAKEANGKEMLGALELFKSKVQFDGNQRVLDNPGYSTFIKWVENEAKNDQEGV